MNIELEISSNFYNALRVVSAKNDVRSYLNGILIDFKKKRWIATDGHRMLIIPMNMDVNWWKDFPKEHLPDELIVETTRRKISGSVCNLHLEWRDNKWTITVCNMRDSALLWQEIVQIIDGKFPNVDRVKPEWPKEDPEMIPFAAYNPEYIADVSKELGIRVPMARVMPIDEAGSSALVEFGSIPREDLMYVLMPMRWSSS